MAAQWDNPCGINERIIVKGNLVLETPTHLGCGDADSPLDMPLLTDPLEGKALLTGASLAGALRCYLKEYDFLMAERLFGKVAEEENGAEKESVQSLLIIDDALGCSPETELRDSVAIDPKTRTAEAKKKFDLELLTAGTEFPLTFELLVLKDQEAELRQALAIVLKGLQNGEIPLGRRKRRGYGRCRVYKWTVLCYNVTTPQGLIAWLEGDLSNQKQCNDIGVLLNTTIPDKSRTECVLEGIFSIDGSLLIRSSLGEADEPDFIHLRSKRNNQKTPILSGTSLAGALRSRALRIANTLGKDGYAITNDLFGYRHRKEEKRKKTTASRMWVEETIIQAPEELVQTRTKIDRFTGGTYPGMLFQEQFIAGWENTRVQVRLTLSKPQDGEVGLLLLLLKDLWTGDLPLGGGSSIGRGRLRGEKAILNYKGATWYFTRKGNGQAINIEGGNKKMLEQFVQSFVKGDSFHEARN